MILLRFSNAQFVFKQHSNENIIQSINRLKKKNLSTWKTKHRNLFWTSSIVTYVTVLLALRDSALQDQGKIKHMKNEHFHLE